ncbi:MAG TPA: hypothetical protein VII09_07340, partial [Opitutaceae bacterium]
MTEPLMPHPPVSQLARWLLGLVLGVSAWLRIVLAMRGGQFFWPDEDRYDLARIAVDDFRQHRWRQGWDLISGADHILFKYACLIPAWIERVLGAPPWFGAALFGLTSVACIYLVWRLILKAGGSDWEALLGAVMMASSNTLFFMARHYFPYDLALMFMLAALVTGLDPQPRRASWAGILTAFGFLSYNGYWWFGGVVLVLCTLQGERTISRTLLVRALLCAVGLLGTIAAAIATGALFGYHFIDSYRKFAATVKMGDARTAWRLVGEYFWHTEHGIVVFWAAAAVACLAAWSVRRVPGRVTLWLGGLLVSYGCLASCSGIWDIFTVAGRHLRPLAVFACLLSAWFLARLASSSWP